MQLFRRMCFHEAAMLILGQFQLADLVKNKFATMLSLAWPILVLIRPARVTAWMGRRNQHRPGSVIPHSQASHCIYWRITSAHSLSFTLHIYVPPQGWSSSLERTGAGVLLAAFYGERRVHSLWPTGGGTLFDTRAQPVHAQINCLTVSAISGHERLYISHRGVLVCLLGMPASRWGLRGLSLAPSICLFRQPDPEKVNILIISQFLGLLIINIKDSRWSAFAQFRSTNLLTGNVFPDWVRPLIRMVFGWRNEIMTWKRIAERKYASVSLGRCVYIERWSLNHTKKDRTHCFHSW